LYYTHTVGGMAWRYQGFSFLLASFSVKNWTKAHIIFVIHYTFLH
jgi:hypothetical protein